MKQLSRNSIPGTRPVPVASGRGRKWHQAPSLAVVIDIARQKVTNHRLSDKIECDFNPENHVTFFHDSLTVFHFHNQPAQRRGIMKKALSLLAVMAGLSFMLAGTALGYEWSTREGQLNINTATMEELMDLPGVNTEMAQNIVAFRNANGPFADLTNLIQVKGFSFWHIDQIRDYVKMEGASDLKVYRHVMPDY